jgi:hypothetical protein
LQVKDYPLSSALYAELTHQSQAPEGAAGAAAGAGPMPSGAGSGSALAPARGRSSSFQPGGGDGACGKVTLSVTYKDLKMAGVAHTDATLSARELGPGAAHGGSRQALSSSASSAGSSSAASSSGGSGPGGSGGSGLGGRGGWLDPSRTLHQTERTCIRVDEAVLKVRAQIAKPGSGEMTLRDSLCREVRAMFEVPFFKYVRPVARGQLRVFVMSASDLPQMDSDSGADPFCVLQLEGQTHRTATVWNANSPAWQDERHNFVFNVSSASSRLVLAMWDDTEAGGEDPVPMGEVSVHFSDFCNLERETVKKFYFQVRSVAVPALSHFITLCV